MGSIGQFKLAALLCVLFSVRTIVQLQEQIVKQFWLKKSDLPLRPNNPTYLSLDQFNIFMLWSVRFLQKLKFKSTRLSFKGLPSNWPIQSSVIWNVETIEMIEMMREMTTRSQQIPKCSSYPIFPILCFWAFDRNRRWVLCTFLNSNVSNARVQSTH